MCCSEVSSPHRGGLVLAVEECNSCLLHCRPYQQPHSKCSCKPIHQKQGRSSFTVEDRASGGSLRCATYKMRTSFVHKIRYFKPSFEYPRTVRSRVLRRHWSPHTQPRYSVRPYTTRGCAMRYFPTCYTEGTRAVRPTPERRERCGSLADSFRCSRV